VDRLAFLTPVRTETDANPGLRALPSANILLPPRDICTLVGASSTLGLASTRAVSELHLPPILAGDIAGDPLQFAVRFPAFIGGFVDEHLSEILRVDGRSEVFGGRGLGDGHDGEDGEEDERKETGELHD